MRKGGNLYRRILIKKITIEPFHVSNVWQHCIGICLYFDALEKWGFEFRPPIGVVILMHMSGRFYVKINQTKSCWVLGFGKIVMRELENSLEVFTFSLYSVILRIWWFWLDASKILVFLNNRGFWCAFTLSRIYLGF